MVNWRGAGSSLSPSLRERCKMKKAGAKKELSKDWTLELVDAFDSPKPVLSLSFGAESTPKRNGIGRHVNQHAGLGTNTIASRSRPYVNVRRISTSTNVSQGHATRDTLLANLSSVVSTSNRKVKTESGEPQSKSNHMLKQKWTLKHHQTIFNGHEGRLNDHDEVHKDHKQRLNSKQKSQESTNKRLAEHEKPSTHRQRFAKQQADFAKQFANQPAEILMLKAVLASRDHATLCQRFMASNLQVYSGEEKFLRV